MRARPVARRGDVGAQRPIGPGQRRRRVARHLALLVVRVKEADVVHNHVHALGEVIHGRDHVEIGQDGAEKELGAGREVVDEFDHRRPLGAALEAGRAEGERLAQPGRVPVLLRCFETPHPVGDDRYADA